MADPIMADQEEKMNIWISIRKTLLVPIHPAGWPFILGFALITAVLAALEELLLFPGLVLTLWCVYFFRNPVRVTPQRDDLVIAPADGRVLSVQELPAPAEMELPEGRYVRVAIFMNVFDVHVNRAPMAGKVMDKFHFPGVFVNASLDKASEMNERLGLVLKTETGKSIGVVQIAGLVARRILCDVSEGDSLKAGAEYGIIRFGSRVDIWLPKPVRVLALPGQRSIAGETVIADFARGAKAPGEGVAS